MDHQKYHDKISARTQELRAAHGTITANRLAKNEVIEELLYEAEYNDKPKDAIPKVIFVINLMRGSR